MKLFFAVCVLARFVGLVVAGVPPPPPPAPAPKPAPEPAPRPGPIVHLTAECPPSSSGDPVLHLVADVPAHANALCKSGAAELTTTNDVDYFLDGTFDTANKKDCLFYKKNGSNTYTVDVEVGWGEEDRQVVSYTQVKTISCAYDDHGDAVTSEETIADWFLSPQEVQNLMGTVSSTKFELLVLDVLNREIDSDDIPIGRKIRLMATNDTGAVAGFKALSCNAINKETSYAILRAGCGDGQVFSKTQGFHTEGNVVYSPYFDAFKLNDGDGIRFKCNFTVCTSRCDGSSCPTERRKRDTFSELYRLFN